MSFAESWKSLGNQAFQQGNFELSLEHFTKAIEADPSNAVYYCNRSLSHASLKNWELSLKDAAIAIKLDQKKAKAHFRYIKALIELEQFISARTALHVAIRECGEKDFRSLEDSIFDKTGVPLRPKSTDFEIISELGDGNFSKVYKTYLKKNKKVFAIKTIEKQTVERMKRRHPNIHNEILMEKRALQKLLHPGIVTLYATFQDYGTLYYQMEYIGGQDLWTNLHEILPLDEKRLADIQQEDGTPISNDVVEFDSVQKLRGRTGAQIGIHWSLLRFYFAQIISAVEHMHQHGIVHRDIKPENIIITTDGHLKFVDFGTAKDMIQTDLNGQEFVGTPEYMSPGTVCVKNGGPPKNICNDASKSFTSTGDENVNHAEGVVRQDGGIGLEADIWALGVVLYQMIFGSTPFQAPSPYLVFLRIKRDLVLIPDWVPSSMSSLIRLLLDKDPKSRMIAATGQYIESTTSDKAVYASISYDPLRIHPFFSNWHEVEEKQQRHYQHILHLNSGPSALIETEALSQIELPKSYDLQAIKDVYNSPACRVPSLHDLCIRAVADTAVKVAFATADNGGIRPKVPWMQKFNLVKLLSDLDLGRIAHLLDRQQKFHIPGVHRLFFNSLPDSRCKKANLSTKEYVGFNRVLQGHYTTSFHFAQTSAPAVTDEGQSFDRFQMLISHINKIRPKFFVVIGNFTSANVREHPLIDYNNAAEKFRKLIARVSDTIPVVFVPGVNEVGYIPSISSLSNYRLLFGADYFSFWYQGMKAIVINSALLINSHGAPEEAELQSAWLEEEIEQAKLCACTIVLFSYHPWYYHQLDEDDIEDSAECVRNIPKSLRLFWMKKFQHHKVKILFSAANHGEGQPSLPFGKKQKADEAVGPESVHIEQSNSNDAVEGPDSDSDGFENVEDYCEGPQLLGSCCEPYRLMKVGEDDICHKALSADSLPASMQEALQLFK